MCKVKAKIANINDFHKDEIYILHRHIIFIVVQCIYLFDNILSNFVIKHATFYISNSKQLLIILDQT